MAMDRVSQPAERSGMYVSPAWQVPKDAAGKVQIALDIKDADRIDPTQAVYVVIERSDDGERWLPPLAHSSFHGNDKLQKPGWPETGCAWRLDVDYFKLSGVWLRLILTSLKAIEYAVDFGVLSEKEIDDLRRADLERRQ